MARRRRSNAADAEAAATIERRNQAYVDELLRAEREALDSRIWDWLQVQRSRGVKIFMSAGGDEVHLTADGAVPWTIAEDTWLHLHKVNTFFFEARERGELETLIGLGGVVFCEINNSGYTGEGREDRQTTAVPPPGIMDIAAARIKAAAELLSTVYPAEDVEKALEDLAAKAKRDPTTRATGEPRLKGGKERTPDQDGGDFAPGTIEGAATETTNPEVPRSAQYDDTRLGRLLARYENRLREIELPEDGFKTKEQATAAHRLSDTLRHLQSVQRDLGLPVTEKPERVKKAEAMMSAYHRHHDKSGAPIAVRSRGRPRRVASELAIPPLR